MKAMKISAIYNVYGTHSAYRQEIRHSTARVLCGVELD